MQDRKLLEEKIEEQRLLLVKLQFALKEQRHYYEIDKKKQEEREKNFVRYPKMIEEFPEGWGFGRAALKAADKLKYNPRVVDGVGQEVPGVLYKFSFQMAK